MKFQASNLLMTVAAIDLTETEMEAIVGGTTYNAAQLTAFWQGWKQGDQTSAINAAKTVLASEVATQKARAAQWYSDLQKSNPQDAKLFKTAFNSYISQNPSSPVVKLFGF
jgi:hypothetical protein